MIDPNNGTIFGESGDDYYGQSVLENRESPTFDDPETDGENSEYQGEGSWMDFDEDDTDGAGSRYGRETPWTTDAALQFDTEAVQNLTVPDLQFSDEEVEAYSQPGQTLRDLAQSVRDSADQPTDATPTPDAPDSFNQDGPGVTISEPADGSIVPSWMYGIGGAGLVAIVGLLALVLGDSEEEG
jgi:hypothetical protein